MLEWLEFVLDEFDNSLIAFHCQSSLVFLHLIIIRRIRVPQLPDTVPA